MYFDRVKESALFRTPISQFRNPESQTLCIKRKKKKIEHVKKCNEKVKCKGPGVCGLWWAGENIKQSCHRRK